MRFINSQLTSNQMEYILQKDGYRHPEQWVDETQQPYWVAGEKDSDDICIICFETTAEQMQDHDKSEALRLYEHLTESWINANDDYHPDGTDHFTYILYTCKKMDNNKCFIRRWTLC